MHDEGIWLPWPSQAIAVMSLTSFSRSLLVRQSDPSPFAFASDPIKPDKSLVLFCPSGLGWPQLWFAQAEGLFFDDGWILAPASSASLPVTRRLPCCTARCCRSSTSTGSWRAAASNLRNHGRNPRAGASVGPAQRNCLRGATPWPKVL